MVYAEWVQRSDPQKVCRRGARSTHVEQSPSIFAATLDSGAKTVIDGVDLMRWEYPFAQTNRKVVRTRCFEFEQVAFRTRHAPVTAAQSNGLLLVSDVPVSGRDGFNEACIRSAWPALIALQKALWVSEDDGDTFNQANFPFDPVCVLALQPPTQRRRSPAVPRRTTA